MQFRAFLAIFVALAVLLAPAFTLAGEASAATGDHHSQMIGEGHCDQSEPRSADDETSPAKPCCVSMCMGVAVPPAGPARSSAIALAPQPVAVPAHHLSHLAEIATPPPRLA